METCADFPDRAETIINAAASRREGHGIADLVTPQLQGVRAEQYFPIPK